MNLALTLFCFVCAVLAAQPGRTGQVSVTLMTSADRVVLTEDCGTPGPDSACTPTAMPFEIAAIAEGFKSRTLTYTYTVTAGKIQGAGARVRWDLSGLEPGNYSVSVKVRDGRGVSVTDSKKVKVEMCTCVVESPP